MRVDAGGRGRGPVEGGLLGGENLLLLLLELGDREGVEVLLLLLLGLLGDLVEVHGERVVATSVQDGRWCWSRLEGLLSVG